MRTDIGIRGEKLAPRSLEGVGRFFFTFLLVHGLTLVSGSRAFGLDSPEVLPRGINSPALRFGNIGGIADTYNAGGGLISLHDKNSLAIDANRLEAADPQVRQLNAIVGGPGVDLGILHIDSKPNIRYTAIVHAWGLSDRWSLGVGMPAVRYTNEVSIWNDGGNIAAYRAAYGNAGAVTAGLDRLANMSVPGMFRNELSAKGYKMPESKDQSLWGDLQIVSMYQLLKQKLTTLTHKLTLVLPTGHRADPNDLADLDLFGRASIDNSLVGAYRFARDWSLNGRGGMTVYIPDRVDKRVPLHDGDVLPDQNGLESVQRHWNLGGGLAGSLNYDFTSELSAGAGYEMSMKGHEKYSGSSSRSYESLARNSDSEAHLARLQLSYSTVGAYRAKRMAFPFVASLDFSDTFAGRNTPRQTVSEFSLTLFY